MPERAKLDSPTPYYFAIDHPHKAASLGFSIVNSHRLPTSKTLITDTARLTGKPIRRRQLPQLAGNGVSGLWFELPDQHLILHPPLSPYHLRYVMGHECGHIIFAWLGWAPVPPLAQMNPHTLSMDELISAASAHRIDLKAPGEPAAELFAIYANESERSTRRKPAASFRSGIG